LPCTSRAKCLLPTSSGQQAGTKQAITSVEKGGYSLNYCEIVTYEMRVGKRRPQNYAEKRRFGRRELAAKQAGNMAMLRYLLSIPPFQGGRGLASPFVPEFTRRSCGGCLRG
jgi:hypothetical protein